MINLTMQTSQSCFDLTRDLGEISSNLLENLRRMNDRGGKYVLESAELARKVFSDLERRAQAEEKNVGILSGIRGLDERTGGFEAGNLVLLAARPSVGKTALSSTMAENMAKEGAVVVYASMEMSGEALTRRRVASESGVFLNRIRWADIEANQWEFLVNACNALADRRLLIIDSPKYKTIEDMVNLVEYLATRHPIGAFFLDYLQLMESRRRFQSRHLEISAISNALKWLAKDLHIPVIALSQLSREIEKRPPSKQRPILSDLKESGDLEADADIVLGLYCANQESQVLEVKCLKGRDIGAGWSCELSFDRHTQRIRG
jgi:replicative DNA helicase